MTKFKVGDRVRAVDETAILVKGREYTVVDPTDIGPAHHVFVNTGFNGVLNYTDDFFELVEPVAAAPAAATLIVEAGKFYKTRDGRKVGPMYASGKDRWPWAAGAGGSDNLWRNNGEWYPTGIEDKSDLVAEWVDEPEVVTVEAGKSYEDSDGNVIGPMFELQTGFFAAVSGNGQSWKADGTVYGSANDPSPLVREYKASEPAAVAQATAAPEVDITVDLDPTPTVGSSVLIPGWITSINHSPKGTVYGVAFETKNRRVSLHFLEEDFITVDEEPDDDCPCFAENDNGPSPFGGDTAKAFDAFGDWLRALATNPSAVFRTTKEAA